MSRGLHPEPSVLFAHPSHTPEEEHECGSAHCIAGWLQALCPDEKLRRISAAAAGAAKDSEGVIYINPNGIETI